MPNPRLRYCIIVAFLSLLIGGGCCTQCAPSSDQTTVDQSIAVSSPYLEAAIRDVLRRDMPIVRMAGPSMCPGHFDMRPSQISQLARCRLLVRFDFQQALDAKLADRAGRSPQSLGVALPGGMCEPDSYLAACRQIADYLPTTGEMDQTEADRRMAEIADRMTALTSDVRQAIDAAGLRNAPVLTSGHQSGFCRWLGLRCVAAYSAADTAGVSELDEAIQAGNVDGVQIIVANQPEGRRLADALADRFDARVVVFANFPEADEAMAFDNLVRRNLAALLAVDRSGEDQP
jgi:zinc transport system substrate-binding protein